MEKFLGAVLLTVLSTGLASSLNDSEPTLEPEVITDVSPERQKIVDAQFKCFEQMNSKPPYQKTGLFCNRTWDGWLCWDDTPAGKVSVQNCPDYFPDFDPTEQASKYCDEHGNWFQHPESNRTWSNYTLCNSFTSEKLKVAYILYYMALVGHALSITSLLGSLGILFYFKSLSCQRITLHKNLFFSYVLNSLFTIVHLIAVVPNPDLVKRDPVSCKVLQFFHQYLMGCNYFWMLCEGIYLHTLIVVAVFAEEHRLHWYYLLGWGFPLLPAAIHAVSRTKFFNDNCWMSVDTHLLYIIHAPIMAALLVNFFFLLNIVRVLVTKLRDTHRAESTMYMKAVRATLILVPLLGIQFVVIPWRPEGKLAGETIAARALTRPPGGGGAGGGGGGVGEKRWTQGAGGGGGERGRSGSAPMRLGEWARRGQEERPGGGGLWEGPGGRVPAQREELVRRKRRRREEGGKGKKRRRRRRRSSRRRRRRKLAVPFSLPCTGLLSY
uniref:Calcitonin receptor n=1 Tax=Sarcophilus harrisii TaxID=9305 RepID=A0A7N4NUB4_SARHA